MVLQLLPRQKWIFFLADDLVLVLFSLCRSSYRFWAYCFPVRYSLRDVGWRLRATGRCVCWCCPWLRCSETPLSVSPFARSEDFTALVDTKRPKKTPRSMDYNTRGLQSLWTPWPWTQKSTNYWIHDYNIHWLRKPWRAKAIHLKARGLRDACSLHSKDPWTTRHTYSKLVDFTSHGLYDTRTPIHVDSKTRGILHLKSSAPV